MVKGVKHFWTYLEGNHFTIQTDHNPLTHLSNLKDSHGRQARWALSLQPYSFTVEHQSRKANSNADGLSRDPQSAAQVGGVSEPRELGDGLFPVTPPLPREDNTKVNNTKVNNNKVTAGNMVCGKEATAVSAGNIVCGKDTTAGNVVHDSATPGSGAAAQMA